MCQVELTKQLFVSDDRNEVWINRNAQHCPGCQGVVQRNGGCNHMVCRCGVHFCYVCGRRWEEHETQRGGINYYQCRLPKGQQRRSQTADLEDFQQDPLAQFEALERNEAGAWRWVDEATGLVEAYHHVVPYSEKSSVSSRAQEPKVSQVLREAVEVLVNAQRTMRCCCVFRFISGRSVGFQLFDTGGSVQGFHPFACCKIRLLEAELRDERERLEQAARWAKAREETPATSQATAPQVAPGPPVPPAEADVPQGLTPKAPSVPPPPSAPGKPQPKEGAAKPEPPARSPKAAESAVKGEAEESPRAASPPIASSSRRQSRRRSRSHRRREERASRSRRRRREDKEDKKRREKSSPKEEDQEGGKERKRKHEKPPEPEGPPPRRRREESEWGPRSPSRPPPSGQRSTWQGEIPYSSHPRWSQGTDKGITKRAKQELYNRQRGRR
eukprot:s185_g15.t1